jgi:hypothetical protein
LRNEGTAFAVAPTPVSDAQSLAKALSSNRMPTVCTAAACCPAVSGVTAGAFRGRPTTITATMAPT